MGLRGPKAKPLELKLLEGNRGQRPLVTDGTFRPEVGLPSVPKDLSPGARKVWKRLSAELLRYNLMSAVYSDAFEDLCESVAMVKMLRHSLAGRMTQAREREGGAGDPAAGLLTSTPNGMAVQHPLYQVLRSERQHMHSCLGKFGLTPAESARVATAVRAQLKLFDQPKADEPKGFEDF